MTRHLQRTAPVRALVVDDSRLMRRMLTAALEAEGTIQVVADAADATEARALIRALEPDVITLDVEMPGMDGLAFLRRIMDLRPMPVLMVSTLTAHGTDTALEALRIGALDAIPKPAGRAAIAPFAQRLRRMVEVARDARVLPGRSPDSGPLAHVSVTVRPEVIAMGASTGGVAALATVLAGLRADGPPVVVAQHMPANFTARFASRLDALLPQDVAEARSGEVLAAGQVRIAPGDRHLCVDRRGIGLALRLDGSGPISGHRPSVDVLFNSVAASAGRGAVGVLLTGMGRDGAAGLSAMRNAGAWCIGQSEESCVVYGMPRAAKLLGASHEELGLETIAERLRGLTGAHVRAPQSSV